MLEDSGPPVFAGRYRYEPVDDEGDQSQSGFTQLVYDLKTERMGVIKRADTTSDRAVRRLKNELDVLKALEGLGVPEIYDTGEAEYDSTNYFYVVIEHIAGLNVGKNLASLTPSDRIELLTQFFNLLAKAHKLGIVHNNIDIKHLIWDPDKKQLRIKDWENARLGVDPGHTIEFADDLASSAGIVFALVTRPGVPMPLKNFALPEESGLSPELPKLPIEFRNICFWAPRSGAVGKPYHTAFELFNASKRWNEAADGREPEESVSPHPKLPTPARLSRPAAFGISLIIVFLFFAFLAGRNTLGSVYAIAMIAQTAISQSVDLAPGGANARFLPTPAPTEIQTHETESTPTPKDISVSEGSPAPRTYTGPILIFDQNSSSNDCWENETNLTTNLWTSEGFTRRRDGYWRFGLERDRTTEQWIQSDFSPCLEGRPISAMALNAWIVRLELERESPLNPSSLESGKEFGFFIEDANGERREYTIWVDKDESMHLRLRENNRITYDEIVLIVEKENLKIDEIYPRLYANFPIQIFFEINNQGLDILYLQQGPTQLPVAAKDMSPSLMVPMDDATRSSFGTVAKFGLIGYGGETQTVIWPLVFLGE